MPRKKKNIWDRRALAILILFAIICFWRGCWGLMDLYLFPNNYELSLWVSVGVGVVILILTQSLIKQAI